MLQPYLSHCQVCQFYHWKYFLCYTELWQLQEVSVLQKYFVGERKTVL